MNTPSKPSAKEVEAEIRVALEFGTSSVTGNKAILEAGKEAVARKLQETYAATNTKTAVAAPKAVDVSPSSTPGLGSR